MMPRRVFAAALIVHAAAALVVPSARRLDLRSHGARVPKQFECERPSCGRSELLGGAARALALPGRRRDVAVYGTAELSAPDADIDPAWETSRARLAEYRRRWGNADAPLGPGEAGALGRWCKAQRRLRASGRLAPARAAALDALGFSWESPADVDDPLGLDWADMCARLAAYRAEHGDCDVPKKFKPDPELGGWVAATRRSQGALPRARHAELDALGFAWVSSRKCGGAWMTRWRELRAFRDEHGHADAARVLGEKHELARWCAAMAAARRDGTLSPKRVLYLDEVGLGA